MILMFSPYAGSAYVQPDSLPDGLRAFVEHQPVTLVVDTVRALLLGQPAGNTGWYAVIWWVGRSSADIPPKIAEVKRRNRGYN